MLTLISLCLLILAFSIWHLRTLHGQAIRLIWLFYGIGFHASLLLLVLGTKTGAIDGNGSFSGPFGRFLDLAMKAILDINIDVLAAIGIISMLIVPQVIAYVFSGISGNASSVLFVGPAIDFLVWFVAKSFITMAGLVSVALGAAIWYRWFGTRNTQFVLASLSIIALTTASAFIVIVTRLLGGELLELIRANCPRTIRRGLHRIHSYASRER
jgi:hypothetical protein